MEFNEEENRISFLAQLLPTCYGFVLEYRKWFMYYLGLVALFLMASVFLKWNFISYCLDLMLGWTIPGALGVFALIILLDFAVKDTRTEREIQEDYEYRKRNTIDLKVLWRRILFGVKGKPYKLSILWGITLLVLGIVALHNSNRYRHYYSFLCNDFYVDTTNGIYHLDDRCDYIGMNDNESVDEDGFYDNDEVRADWYTGEEVEDGGYELCKACNDYLSDIEADEWEYKFRRP